ncbi:hypothetical protein R3P38DRAFT_2808261 [Favolaschia claudopus]|uniref:Uncharacterized protein n=1 Tax=Favolaschia claudopus TaxID=2862362 RepID=A0AAV9ZH28_9AGAR
MAGGGTQVLYSSPAGCKETATVQLGTCLTPAGTAGKKFVIFLTIFGELSASKYNDLRLQTKYSHGVSLSRAQLAEKLHPFPSDLSSCSSLLMPAPTKQRKGALQAAQTKKSAQTAHSKAAEASAQTEDPDFVDETDAETEFEGDDQVEKDEGVGGGSRHKPLTDAQSVF